MKTASCMRDNVFAFLLLSLSAVSAQRDLGPTVPLVHLRVAFANGTCDALVYVTLSTYKGTVIKGSKGDRCQVDFTNVPEGDYHVNVSGTDLTTTYADSNIYVSSKGPAEFDVELKRATIVDQNEVLARSLVSQLDLAVPVGARKELDKAVVMIRRQDLQHAMRKLNKAIRIYPQYGMAYNNLGVIYSLLGDSGRANEALQKAISLYPGFRLAYLNLGKLDLREGRYPAAEAALSKAVGLNPHDPVAMVLLCYAELMDKAFDATIATSRKAHLLAQPHTNVHRYAARAFEMENQGQNAIAELETLLQEESTGVQADYARREIDALKTAMATQPR